jgi:hypothetical protein
MKTSFDRTTSILVLLSALVLASSVFAGAPSSAKNGSAKDGSPRNASAGAAVVHLTDAGSMRVAGEQRFHANCGRCHATPQKFPPRMMGTILRHMRVRATITDEDRRLILLYMTQ